MNSIILIHVCRSKNDSDKSINSNFWSLPIISMFPWRFGSQVWVSERPKGMHQPGIEPEAPARCSLWLRGWQAEILPLNHWCWWSFHFSSCILFFSENIYVRVLIYFLKRTIFLNHFRVKMLREQFVLGNNFGRI